MSNISTTADRWEHGWELRLDGEVVTQATTVEHAAQQIRDYLDTVTPEVDHSEWEITINTDLGVLGPRVRAARESTDASPTQ